MKKLYSRKNYDAVIDATHPFATVVSENIKLSLKNFNIPLLRFERNTSFKENFSDSLISFFKNSEECAMALTDTDGKIFLTTGSKDLHIFCRDESVKKRITARVLPGLESIKLCYDAGLEGRQIIAMQGPFSQKMNEIQLKESDAAILVTKESGKTGGADEKLLAALNTGIKCFVIKAPETGIKSEIESESDLGSKNYKKVSSYEELCRNLTEITGRKIKLNSSLNIILAGIGMGNPGSMTLETEQAVQKADLIFGAERMINSVESRAQKLPYYLAENIIPVLKEKQKENFDFNAVILFSGDTGFFSGAQKLKSELEKLENVKLTILPGISSLSYLASKTGMSYQKAEIISLHGVAESEWLPVFKKSTEEGKQIFMLTSGPEDVQKIGKLLEKNQNLSYKIYIGFNLSYESEKVMCIKAAECSKIKEKGLYSLMLVPEFV